jgi:hypothetical protein
MTKKHFIALADALRDYGQHVSSKPDWEALLHQMADFCTSQNPRFDRARWLGYIEGECGPNGGAVKG